MRGIQESILSFLRERDARRHLAFVVCIIAVATVLAVFWTLHINGITLSGGELICGLEEHTHTADCYAWVAVEEETEGNTEPEETEGSETTETEESETTETEESEVAETEESEATKTEESEATGTEESEETETAANTVSTESTESEDNTASESEDAEETDSPQPGDTKEVNGVTYIYSLVCEMEEHTHTDDCYVEDTETEASTDTEETSASVIEVNGASVTSMVLGSLLGATNATGSEDPSDYNLAYTVDGMPESGTYILYTYDDGTYYVLETDGTLTACTEISSITSATGDGPYYVTSTGVIVYGTSDEGDSAYSAAKWTVTQDDSDSSEYTIAYTDDSSNTTYLAPTGTADDVTIGTTAFSAQTGYVTLSGDFELTYTFRNESHGTENWENFVLEINNGSTNGIGGEAVYIDVRADYFGWFANNSNEKSNTNPNGTEEITFGGETSGWDDPDWSTWAEAMRTGLDCTVTVVRSENTFTITWTMGDSYKFSASTTVALFDGCVANVYLTGENCTILNLKYYFSNTVMDKTSEITTPSTSNVSSLASAVVRAASSYSSTVTLTEAADASVDSGKTGVSISHSMLTSVLTESSGTAAWDADESNAMIFYFARAISTASDEYYFSEAVTLKEVSEEWQENTYLVYTQINGIYYLVSAVDGSLLACTDLETGTNYSEAQKALLSEEAGVYIWEFDNDGEPVFKFTSETGSSTADFADYMWGLTESSADADTGSGSYTIYNDENGKYLSAGLYAETISSSNITYSNAGKINDYGTMVFSVTDMQYGGSGVYYVQITVADASNPDSKFVRRTLYAERANSWAVTFPNNSQKISGYSGYTETTTGSMTLSSDDEETSLTITVITDTDGLTIVYYDGAETITYTVDIDFSSGAIVNFYSGTGSYKITPTSSNIASYVRTSLNADPVTLTAVTGEDSTTAATAASYYWTAASTANNTNFSLIAQRETANNTDYEIEWVYEDYASAESDATGTAVENIAEKSMTSLASDENHTITFSLARVRNNYVWFDGTSGGMDSYASNASATAYDEIKMATYDAYGNYNQTITTPTASDVTDASGYGTTTNAGYTLRGWYDIYNNKYYKPGETLSISSNTVMYADWEVASYDIGESSNLADSVSTNSFITTRLYDYNELFNAQSTLLDDSVTRSTTSGGTDYSVTDYRTLTLTGHRDIFSFNDTTSMFLEASSLGFLFFRTERYSYYYSELGTTVSQNDPLIDYPEGRGGINASSSGATQTIMGSYGTSQTDTTASTLLTPLYGTDNTVTDVTDPNTESYVLGKTYVGTADYLFQYDTVTGYYYYDSSRNAASYNASEGRFYVYDYTVSVSSDSDNDFLPFNYATSSNPVVGVNNVNYWFGMTTEIEFYLPYDVPNGSGDNNYGNVNLAIDNSHHMTFKFSGDDDVWVFVDGQLVLDLGGVHGKVYGEIDFSTGEVVVVNTVNDDTIYYNGDTWSGSTTGVIDYTSYASTNNYVKKQSSAETYVQALESGSHTLTFYYLERGAGESNSAVYTNISTTTYNLNLSKVAAGTNTALSGAEFTFYTDSDFTKLASLEKEDGTSASTFSMPDETACKLVEGKLYYVVETKAPDGYTSAGKYFTVLLVDDTLTITVYDTSGTVLETYVYKVVTDTSGGGTTYSLEPYSSSISGSSDWNYIVSSEASLEATVGSNNVVQYYKISLTVANTTGYEIPSAGSSGIFTGLMAGVVLILLGATGLVIRTFYQIVWERRLRTVIHKREHTEDKAKRRNIRIRTRGHPRERNVLCGHARERPGNV